MKVRECRGPIVNAGAASHAEIRNFMTSLGYRFRPDEAELITMAYRIAKAGHCGQLRDNGAPYFEHLRETVQILVEELGIHNVAIICAAFLHDAKEDSTIISDRLICALFGEQVLGYVKTVTKPKRNDKRFKSDNERHQFYFDQIAKAAPEEILLKLSDRLQNMRNLLPCRKEKRQRKIEETKRVYLPLIKKIQRKFPEQAKILSEQFSICLEYLSKAIKAS